MAGSAREEGLDPELDLWWVAIEVKTELAGQLRREVTEPLRRQMAEEMRRAVEPFRRQIAEQLRRAASEAWFDEVEADDEGEGEG